MLSRKKKLSREQFNFLLKQRQKRINTCCGVFSYKENPPEGFHVSVVISKKVTKKAHERNYGKRVLYTLLSKYIHLPFLGYLLVSKDGYTLLLKDQKKVDECLYEFFEKYSQK